MADTKKRKKKKKGFFDRVGDVASSVVHASDTAQHALGSAIGGAISTVDEHVAPLGALDSAASEVGNAIKGASRAAFTALQTPAEAVAGDIRSAIAHPQSSGGLLPLAPRTMVEGGKQTTVGQAVKQQVEKGHVDLGKGFFPSGEVAKQQAAAARSVASIDGHAATLGRLAATLVAEPGSAPYKVLSGLVDAGVSWYGDPAAQGLKAVGESGKAAETLGQVATGTEVERAAAKASPEWRQTVGLVTDAHRDTVVPAAVDKYLYSDEFQKVANRIADTRSPTEIWRASDKQMPVTLAAELADHASDPGQVAATLRPHLGLDVVPGDFGGLGMKITQSAQRQLRSFNVMPDTWLPWDDAETFVRNLDNSLANAKVNGGTRDAILDEAFRTLASPTAGRQKRLLDTAARATEESLKSYGVDDTLAKSLTSWSGEADRTRHFLTDDAGRDVNFGFLTDADGNQIQRARPAALIDLLNSGTFLYSPQDVRTIRQLTSRLAPITSNPAFKYPVSMVTALQQEIWKPLATIRAAYFTRVNSEEVARSMASGTFGSLHDWFNFAARGRGASDAKGGLFDVAKEADQIVNRLATEHLDDAARSALTSRLNEINDEISRGKTAFDQARVGKAWKHNDWSSVERNMVRSGNWQVVHKGSDPARWVRGLADETIAMTQDPIIRRVANGGIFAGDSVDHARPGLDGIKDWMRSGAGQLFRKRFEDAYPGIDFNAETVLDDVIDKARMRLDKLGPDTELRDAIANGGRGLFTQTKDGRVPTDELLNRLKTWRDNPGSPEWQKVEQLVTGDTSNAGRASTEALKGRDAIVSAFYGTLYGKTSDYLARSPVFRSEYWNRMEGLVPHLDDASRAEVLANAEKAGLGKAQLGRLAAAAKTPAGAVDLEAADNLAKGWALDKTKELLFDASEKSQFFDIGRAVFPFGEAWKEVLGRWAKLAVTSPQVPRRYQQIVQGARGAGIFHRDPATGQEMFSYPLPGPLADYLGANFQGSVQGLSLGTSVMPGLGPVAAVAANKVIPNTPNLDFVRSMVFPYGEPSSVLGQLAPAWAKKAIAAWEADPQKDRVFANSYFEVVQQLQASGKYGTDPDEKQRLLSDALGKARVITGLRALLQFGAPSAPQIQYMAKTKNGDVVAALLVKKFHELQADDYDTAVQKFFDTYGEQAYSYLVGKTKSTIGGQQASTEYGQWEAANGDLIKKYPLVAGYFGPQAEGFNSTVFARQETAGNRERRTASQAIDDAQATLASWIYQNNRQKVAGRTDAAAQDWLRNVKTDLEHDYPGWNPDAAPNNLPGRVRQLQGALNDPKVKNTEVGNALGIYLARRQDAIDAAKAGGLTSPFTAKRTKYLRDWLRQVGTDLSADYPSFGRVWDDVLSHEMKDDTETTP